MTNDMKHTSKRESPSHTPGFWSRNIPPASKYTTIFAGRNTHVAYLATESLSEEEIEANANLIASAPELLYRLQQVTTMLAMTDSIYWADYIAANRAVIAQASGAA